MSRLLRKLLLLGCLVAVAGAQGHSALAAAGITINPFNQSLVIPADSQSYPFSLTVTNNTGYGQALTARAVDLNGLDDSGGIQIAQNPASVSADYQLASYLQLDDTAFSLAAGETRVIHGTVIHVQDLTPGTHYAALLVGKPAVTPSGSKVPLQTVIASSLLVRKVGGERYGLALDAIDHTASWWKRLELTLHFRNTGNVGLVPRGVVRVLDPFGKEVARGAINEGSGIILPGASRKFQIAESFERPVLWPGRYTYIVQYRYNGKDDFAEQRLSFTYLDLRSVTVIVLLLVSLAGLVWLIAWVLRRRHKRRK